MSIIHCFAVLKYQSSPRHMYPFCNKVSFYGEKFLALRPTPKLDDYPLSTVRDCFTVVADIHTGGRSSTHILGRPGAHLWG